MILIKVWSIPVVLLAVLTGCKSKNTTPSGQEISDLHLKRGTVISCGSPDKEFGVLQFDMSCDPSVQQDFNTAVELLHSFEYDEAEKMFARVIDASPSCPMAYWGIAMCSYHPLWEPPSETDLQKGSRAITLARALQSASPRETGFINAIAAYYDNWTRTDPKTRSRNFEQAMESLYRQYPDDTEVAIFYALALDASADAADQSYTNQRKAGAILKTLYQKQSNHPGIIHYIIHTYDYPVIAAEALEAARKYALVAPSSAHALHMPSHIFTRLGSWDECIAINIRSVAAAKCYAEAAGFKGHWDEELHGLDYLVYAYLQKGDNQSAREQLDYIHTIHEVFPVNFKEAYTFAAAPSRLALENKNWTEAKTLTRHPAGFAWEKFPWQEAILHFARLLGHAHTRDPRAAKAELDTLLTLQKKLLDLKDQYKSNQVAIQIRAGDAWIRFMNGNKTEALHLMQTAADMEDNTSKHPVTPGEVLPARELYADMLLELHQYKEAGVAYEAVLKKSPNRFNSLYGAAVAAEKTGDKEKAVFFYQKLISQAAAGSNRPEILNAKNFMDNQ